MSVSTEQYGSFEPRRRRPPQRPNETVVATDTENDTGTESPSRRSTTITTTIHKFRYRYRHNLTVSISILPPLLLLYHQVSSYLTQITILYVLLVIYAVDLSGTDKFSAVFGIYTGFFVVVWALWIDGIVGERGAGVRAGGMSGVVVGVGDLGSETLLVLCLAFWGHLQIKPLAKIRSYLKPIERCLHVVLPIVSSTVLLRKLVTHFDGDIGVIKKGGGDWMALACPHIFVLWFGLGIATVSGSVSSFAHDDDNDTDDDEDTEDERCESIDGGPSSVDDEAVPFETDTATTVNNICRAHRNKAITLDDGRTLTQLFFMLPTLIHLVIFRRRLFVHPHRLHFTDLADFVLVLVHTFIWHYASIRRGWVWWESNLHPFLRVVGEGKERRGLITAVVVYLGGVFSVQYRYVVPFLAAHRSRYGWINDNSGSDNNMNNINDGQFEEEQRWRILVCSTIGMFLLTFPHHWGGGGGCTKRRRKSTLRRGELLLRDSTTICGIVAMAVGFGVPWIGVMVYLIGIGASYRFGVVSVRWLRLTTWCVLLFIIDPVTLLSDRLPLFQKSVWIVPGIVSTSIKTFGYLVVLTLSLLLFSTVTWSPSTLSVSTARLDSEPLFTGRRPRWRDMMFGRGTLSVLCAGMLIMLEGAWMYGSPRDYSDSAGQWTTGFDVDDYVVDDDTGDYETLYYPLYVAVATGVITTFLFWRSWKENGTTQAAVSLYFSSVSMCVGKMIAVSVVGDPDDLDTVRCSANSDGEGSTAEAAAHVRYLVVTFTASMLVFAFGLSHLYPEHILKTGGQSSDLIEPSQVFGSVFAFLGVFLPFAVPVVVKPMADLFLLSPEERYVGCYEHDDVSSLQTAEVLGYSASLWGFHVLLVLSRLSHHHHGRRKEDKKIYHRIETALEPWRIASCVSLFVGIILSLTVPDIPFSDNKKIATATASSLYTSISSKSLMLRSKNGFRGGWGIVYAALALVYAAIRPLDPCSKRFNNSLFLFSLFFGGGVSWFVTMQTITASNDVNGVIIYDATDDKPSMIDICFIWIPSLLISCLATMVSVLGYKVEASHFIGVVVRIVKIIVAVFFGLIVLIILYTLSLAKDPDKNTNSSSLLSTLLYTSALNTLILSIAVRLREKKKTLEICALGNVSCIVSWLLWLVVVYRKYGLASIGVVSHWGMGKWSSVVYTMMLMLILLLIDGHKHRSHQKNKALFIATCLPLSRPKRSCLAFTATGLAFVAVSLYAVLLRGLEPSPFEPIVSHEDVFRRFYGAEANTTSHRNDPYDYKDTVGSIERYHAFAVVQSAKLSACSFWTSWHAYHDGPILHLIGILTVTPIYLLVVSSLLGQLTWKPLRIVSAISAFLPVNAFPLLLCSGIPSLHAASLIGFLVGFWYISYLMGRQNTKKNI